MNTMKKLFAVGLGILLGGVLVHAVTVDVSKGGYVGYDDSRARLHYVLEGVVDFHATNAAAGDVYQVIKIPEGTFVERVCYRVETNEGAALTFDVGDDENTNGYFSAANGNIQTNVVCGFALTATNAIQRYTFGKAYSASNTIDVIPQGAATNARIWIRVDCLNAKD